MKIQTRPICANEIKLDRHFCITNSFLAPDYIVEVGSFDGETLKKYGSYSPYSKLIGFECNPHNYFRSCLGKPVTFMAVSNHSGVVDITVPTKRNRASNSKAYLARTAGIDKSIDVVEFEKHQVPCTTLDDFFSIPISQNKTFSLIIDAEGETWNILSGAKKLLEHTVSLKFESETRRWFENSKLYEDIEPLVSNFYLCGHNRLPNMSDKHFQFNYYYVKDEDTYAYFGGCGAD